MSDRRFARDVAKHIDRRRLRRRMLLWTLLFAVVAGAALYVRCGAQFGLGGGGLGPGDGDSAPRRVASGLRCAIRVTPNGIAVDGKRMTREQAVAACKAIGGADAIVTGDAREGDWKELLAALHAAGITDIVVRETHAPPAGSASR
jgi:hypothetical protein